MNFFSIEALEGNHLIEDYVMADNEQILMNE